MKTQKLEKVIHDLSTFDAITIKHTRDYFRGEGKKSFVFVANHHGENFIVKGKTLQVAQKNAEKLFLDNGWNFWAMFNLSKVFIIDGIYFKEDTLGL